MTTTPPLKRCGWCSEDPLYIQYHDTEWGKPQYDEHALFEMLCLEGQQAGLSWITVLKKRENYRSHFFQYPIAQIAALTDQELEAKLTDAGIIRHIGKLKSIRDNAIAWQHLKAQHIDMVRWLWDFVEHCPVQNDLDHDQTTPTQTDISLKMSKALKKNGFKFVGPTIMYAFMQAVGMVNDHEPNCHFRVLP